MEITISYNRGQFATIHQDIDVTEGKTFKTQKAGITDFFIALRCTIMCKFLEPHPFLYIMLRKCEMGRVIYWNMTTQKEIQ